MVLVLKTSVGQLTAGSNPALSAKKMPYLFYKNEITEITLAAGGAITAGSSTAAANTAT